MRGRAPEVADDPPVGEKQHAIGDRRGVRVVRDHHGRLTERVDGLAQQRQDLAARGRVEVAGRLVGEHHARTRHERPRDRDPLLLAARQLRRAVRETITEPDLLDQLGQPLRVRLAAGELERQRDVLGRREHRQQVEELKDEPDVVTAQLGQLRVVERRDLDAGDRDLARRRPVQPGEDVHQRRLARARRAHHRGQPPLSDLDGHAAQRVDRRVALAVAAHDAAAYDDRRPRTAVAPLIPGTASGN